MDMHFGNWGLEIKDNKLTNIVIYDYGIITYYDDNEFMKSFLFDFIKGNPLGILQELCKHFKKLKLNIPIEFINNTKKQWEKKFNWNKDLNILIKKLMQMKIKVPSNLSSIILTYSLISRLALISLSNSNEHKRKLIDTNKKINFLNLYNNSIKFKFKELQLFFEENYLKSNQKAFSFFDNSDKKYLRIKNDNYSDSDSDYTKLII